MKQRSSLVWRCIVGATESFVKLKVNMKQIFEVSFLNVRIGFQMKPARCTLFLSIAGH